MVRYLKNQPFYRYHQLAFPKLLRNDRTIFYGMGINSQVFGFDEDEFVYVRSTNPMLESISLWVDFEEDYAKHIPKVERLTHWEAEFPIQWFKAEKLYKLSKENHRKVRRLLRFIDTFPILKPHAALNGIEKVFPEYYESIETLINRAQDWSHLYKFDAATCNIMERKDGTIVFNDLVHLYNETDRLWIKNLKYHPVIEETY